MSDHADPTTDAVLGHASDAAGAFRAELLAALERRLGPLWDHADPDALAAEARAVLEDHVGPLARLITDAGLASWLHGAALAVRHVPAAVLPPAPVTTRPEAPAWSGMRSWRPVVEHAVSSLRSRPVVTREEFDALADESRREAFTVAYETSAAAAEKVRDAVADAVERGDGFEAFRQRMAEDVDTSRLGTGHLDNVFRTNAARAYSAGMDRVLADPLVDEAFPFEETVPIPDSRMTELCETISRSGIQETGIYLRDDPVYQEFKPPRHWRCRCSRRPMSVRDAARRGIRYAQEWERRGKRPPNPPYVDRPPVELPAGWVPAG